MNDQIDLRNSVHKDSFRFEVTPDLWKTLYDFDPHERGSNLVTVAKNGRLRGYAVYHTFVRGMFKQLSVLEICADGKTTLAELVDRLKERAEEEDADLIYLRKAADSGDRVFYKKGFLSFIESIIMVALLNPYELLQTMSQELDNGKNLRLNIKGFNPVTVQVGKNGIKVLAGEKAHLTVSTDSQTFLKLLFGRASFWKELFKGTVKIHGITGLSTARRFFNAVKHKKWHIPFADWV